MPGLRLERGDTMANRRSMKPTLMLTAFGLCLNLALVWLTKLLRIPLYLDSIGTVITAALGGALPGIAVGFLSNCMTVWFSLTPDPMTLYYGFLNVAIACLATWFSRKRLFLKWYGMLGAVFAFSFVGGALGSVVTWYLYGFSFGQGISAPLANLLFHSFHMAEFPAQFTADMVIDFLDKLLTTGLLGLTLHCLPSPVLERMPLGDVYLSARRRGPGKASQPEEQAAGPDGGKRRKRSLNTRITMLLIDSSVIISVVAVLIGGNAYREKMIAQYTDVCNDAVSMMLRKIDGDRIDEYLALGEAADGYAETERELHDILSCSDTLTYLYVYRIKPDGCNVVFDIDTPQLAGEPVGTVVPFDASFPYKEAVLAGEEIPPFITNDTYGWLLTVYRPIVTTGGEVAAYAAADIDMKEIKTEIYSYCISIVSLLFGVVILITTFSLWYCDKRLLEPIGNLMRQARSFDFDGTSVNRPAAGKYAVTTGDELEELSDIMRQTEEANAEHSAQLRQKNVEIAQMQRNIIYTLANMVENRDESTGGHIKRTANYVRLIGSRLLAAGLYPETVNAQYVKRLYDSAPLHDIGKIKITDSILNKPGRLTTDEFNQMKTHTTQGREILLNSLHDIEDGAWLSMAVDMATYHHERWDGTGYPEGLSGEDIPLCARIMAVSDVFDALVTARSYKAAFPYEQAIDIIRGDAGKHFDPVIVEVFLDADAEIRQIMASA